MKTDRVVQIANLTITKRKNPQRRRVYSQDGLAPSVVTMTGGNLEPLIPVVYESDKLREQGSEQRRLGQGRTPADAGTELRQVLQRRDELAEGLYDSNGL